MAWTIDYTDTAKTQLRKLDKQAAKRILDFMDERIVGRDDPRSTGKALTGPLGGLWRYRIGDFQVIQHRLVDMFMEAEQATSMTLMGTLRLDDAERTKWVSQAKAKINKGARALGQWAVQTSLGGHQSIDALVQEGGRLRVQRDLVVSECRQVHAYSIRVKVISIAGRTSFAPAGVTYP